MVHNCNLTIKTVVAIIVIALAACSSGGSSSSGSSSSDGKSSNDSGQSSANISTTTKSSEKVIASGYTDDLEWKIVGTTLIFSGNGRMKVYSAPIDIPWYQYRQDITELKIDGVENIASFAFFAFSKLTSVTIPNSVETIGKWAFKDCEKLKTIIIPNSVNSIGQDVFGDCKNLTFINVDENNTKFSAEDGVLFNKAKTTLIKYPIGKTNATYTIPNTVTHIGESAFEGNKNLKSVIIPSSVKSIYDKAFASCGLTEVTNYATHPQGLYSNYAGAFSGTSIGAARLRVPANSKEAYRSAQVWKDFGGIVAIPDLDSE